MTAASGQAEEEVIRKLLVCQSVLDEKVMPGDWKTSVLVSIYKEKGDVVNCGFYRGVQLLMA